MSGSRSGSGTLDPTLTIPLRPAFRTTRRRLRGPSWSAVVLVVLVPTLLIDGGGLSSHPGVVAPRAWTPGRASSGGVAAASSPNALVPGSRGDIGPLLTEAQLAQDRPLGAFNL